MKPLSVIHFEWDTHKEKSNQKKHGVSFVEAQSVFYDEYAVQFFDDEHYFNTEEEIVSFVTKIAAIREQVSP